LAAASPPLLAGVKLLARAVVELTAGALSILAASNPMTV
jgi:hypothetical protein